MFLEDILFFVVIVILPLGSVLLQFLGIVEIYKISFLGIVVERVGAIQCNCRI